jgi:hypothetical protein
MKGFTLRGFSTATFGLAVGLLCAWLLTRVQISNCWNSRSATGSKIRKTAMWSSTRCAWRRT